MVLMQQGEEVFDFVHNPSKMIWKKVSQMYILLIGKCADHILSQLRLSECLGIHLCQKTQANDIRSSLTLSGIYKNGD